MKVEARKRFFLLFVLLLVSSDMATKVWKSPFVGKLSHGSKDRKKSFVSKTQPMTVEAGEKSFLISLFFLQVCTLFQITTQLTTELYAKYCNNNFSLHLTTYTSNYTGIFINTFIILWIYYLNLQPQTA